MERIIIKNFGPIKVLDLDIKDFILFVGPQASGKSTIAKTIFFFKSLNDDLVKLFIDYLDKKVLSKITLLSFKKVISQKFLDYFGPSAPLKGMELTYYYKEEVWIKITLELTHSYITPTFSPLFESQTKSLIQEVNVFSKKTSPEKISLLTSKDLVQMENSKKAFIDTIDTKSRDLFGETREILFIPAGRSLLATLSDQLQYIEPRRVDFLMKRFIDKINLLRPMFSQSINDLITARMALDPAGKAGIDFARVRAAEKIINKILKGKYKYDRDGEKIYVGETNKYVKLNFASSGQQESLWILLLIFIFILEQQNVFVVIEEPEAHLFPEAQKDICTLIALLSNMKQSQVIITTHSPYVLASINNLILANKVGINHPNEVSKKINRHLWINRNKVYAAMVESGKIKEIIDSEFDIIQQEVIDNVTQQINDEFDFLYQYEAEENQSEK